MVWEGRAEGGTGPSWKSRPKEVLSRSVVPDSATTLCSPTDCSPPGSSGHGILQARTLEWVAMPSSRGSSALRD